LLLLSFLRYQPDQAQRGVAHWVCECVVPRPFGVVSAAPPRVAGDGDELCAARGAFDGDGAAAYADGGG
jgi:hypothetical protein